MSKGISTFVSLVIALIQGDDAEVKAIKIQRKASASLTAQIAVKTAETLSLEESVETAQEELDLARINKGELIVDTENYIVNLLRKQSRLDSAIEKLEVHLDTISFLEEQLVIVKG